MRAESGSASTVNGQVVFFTPKGKALLVRRRGGWDQLSTGEGPGSDIERPTT